MANAKPRLTEIWETPPRPVAHPRPDLSVLGSDIKRLAPRFWQARMFFRGARDKDLRTATGTFPETQRKLCRTHPIFVLKVLGDLGHQVCPCSSKNWGVHRCIRKGCVLEMTGTVMDRNSYLVENCAFNLPRDPAFVEGLFFVGRVPETCLECCS